MSTKVPSYFPTIMRRIDAPCAPGGGGGEGAQSMSGQERSQNQPSAIQVCFLGFRCSASPPKEAAGLDDFRASPPRAAALRGLRRMDRARPIVPPVIVTISERGGPPLSGVRGTPALLLRPARRPWPGLRGPCAGRHRRAIALRQAPPIRGNARSCAGSAQLDISRVFAVRNRRGLSLTSTRKCGRASISHAGAGQPCGCSTEWRWASRPQRAT